MSLPEDMYYLTPEMIDPTLLLPKKRRVLLLCSYCADDNPNCSSACPCNDCLRMCNVAEVVVGLSDITGRLGEIP